MESQVGGIGWFEVGTADPETAERFYGGLFGWTFQPEGEEYRTAFTAAGQPPSGGLKKQDGTSQGYAIFYVHVEDVARALERAEALGGKTLVPPSDGGDGLTFAHLADPAGNHFGIFAR
jgi:uncharacterized protein